MIGTNRRTPQIYIFPVEIGPFAAIGAVMTLYAGSKLEIHLDPNIYLPVGAK